jgi:hypothetical protein
MDADRDQPYPSPARPVARNLTQTFEDFRRPLLDTGNAMADRLDKLASELEGRDDNEAPILRALVESWREVAK